MAARPARVLLGAAALVVGAGTVATQVAAAHFHYPAQFGSGLIDVARQRLYAPWSFLVWYGRYQTAYPRAFAGAALAGFAVIALPCLVLIGRARRGAPTPSAFGQGAWAQLRDVRRAGFIRRDGAPAVLHKDFCADRGTHHLAHKDLSDTSALLPLARARMASDCL